MMETAATQVIEKIVWDFPGGVWGLAIAALLIAAVTVTSYCFTLHRLAVRQRAALIALRLCGGALLLLCLANPRRVEETTTVLKPKAEKMLVLFDTSSSMTQPGLVKSSRLEDSLALWNRVDPGKGEARYAGFDRGTTNYPSSGELARAVSGRKDLRPTGLAAALTEAAERVASEGFTRLVCFTDGVETVAPDAGEAAAAAVSGCPVPVDLVVADTELAMKRYVALTRIESPTQVVVNARAPVAVLAAYSNLIPSDELTAVFSDEHGKEFRRETAKRGGAGGNALFRCELPAAAERGVHNFQLTLLVNGKAAGNARWSVETVARERKRILLYQGTYDWAARFFKNALGRGAEHTELEVRTSGAKHGNNEFPGAEELKKFDAVFLLNLERSQCTAAMENALAEYLSGGGGVLFITGNPRASAEFAGSPIEALLPVEFERKLPETPHADTQISHFREKIQGYRRGVNLRAEALLVHQKEEAYRPEPMSGFVLTPTGAASPIFRRPDGGVIRPSYLDIAPVHALKPGAEALATGPGPGGTPRVVLAAQRFGRGRSAVLATDPLWRWRLTLPSESRDCEYFWGNLAGWLGNAGKITSGGWRLDGVLTGAGKKTELRFFAPGLDAASTSELHFCAVDPDGKTHALTLLPGKAGHWQGDFTPVKPGIWKLCAKSFPAQTITVAPRGGERELEQLAPNENLFRALAEGEGTRVHRLSALASDPQKLLADTPGRNTAGEVRLSRSRETALWWHWEIFAAFLALYLAELLLRRFMTKLV